MKKTIITALSFALCLSANSYGQEQENAATNTFDLSMQFRPRAEYRDGYLRPLAEQEQAAALISSRLRLNADYEYADLLQTKITFQNISLWGQAQPVQGINPPNNSIGIYEAWADLKLYKGLRARIGRQAILLDDQRLFSVADWTQGGRSHDALSVYYTSGKLDIKTFFAFNQNYNALYQGNLNNLSGNLYNRDNAQVYKYMQTLWAGYTLSKQSKISFLFANLGWQHADMTQPQPDERIANLQTTGLHYNLNNKSIRATLSGYYQFGKDMQHTDVSAYLLSAGLTGQLTPAFTLGFRTDYLSGNSLDAAAGTNHSFYSLFGTNHPFYGQMDYYPYGDAGLWNNVLTAGYTFSDKTNVQAAGHVFFAAHEFEQGGTTYQRNLGQEIDLNFNYRINPFTTLSVGYAAYLTTDNLLALKDVAQANPYQHWAWLSLNVTPHLFKAKF